MLSFIRLRRNPRLLRSLTGLTLPQCTELTSRLEPLWAEEETARLSRRDRERAVGAGHPYHLRVMGDKLLLLLTGFRHGLTHELLGCMFDLHQSNVTRLLHRLVPLMESAADPSLKTFLREAQRRRRKIGTLEEFLEIVPELREILGDATEQRRQRPKGKRTQKRYYSGKKKVHTLKTEILATPEGRILHVSRTHPGRTHDLVIHEGEKLPALIPKEARQFYDLGYEGLQHDHPEQDIRLPYKRHGGGPGRPGKAPPLTRGQKQANTLRRTRRVRVEHAFARLKQFRILSGVWRSREESYNQTFRSIAALCNFRLAFPGI